ncbi:hypothetical protein JNW91_03835 [Micromonospora sp. STR1_7]|uniref:Uncharacterized protein n=1 Tax=Micromonospora parastrephiae TaxID=2806101 RepID=A0ABS1XP87_9ACTN|nr:hypothetical protein [Micromonospora parastrephiae]MBM0231081.1 hypothetical protein [Micromonospora parastrephiae]
MTLVGTRAPLAVPVVAFRDREPDDDPLDQDAGLLMTLAAGTAAAPVGGGWPLEQKDHDEAGPDGSQDQRHPPGEPAPPVGRGRNRSGRRTRRRGSIDGTSHAARPLPLGIADSW